MPTVISTSVSTGGVATQAFNQRKVDRNQDGTLWSFANAAAASVTPYYSKDNGATWTAATALPGLTNASLFIDLDDYAHVVWKQSGTAGPNGATLTAGYVLFMRGTPNAGRTAWTWSAAVQIGASAAYDFPDVIAHREGTGWKAHCVFSFNNTTSNFATYQRIDISATGTAVSAGLVGTNLGNSFDIGGSYNVNAHTFPSIDFNHTGDGKTVAGGTPHLYVGWTAGASGAGLGVRFRKAVYSAGAWTWNAERELNPNAAVTDTAGGRHWLITAFDGVRVTLTGSVFYNTINGDTIYSVQRDAPDTTTTEIVRVSPTAAAELLYSGSATYDSAGNVYLFGRDGSGANGTRLLNLRKWTRATATLGPIVTFDTTGNDAPYISAKRGYSSNSIDWVYTDGTASPYNVTFERIALTTTPYVPAIML